MSTKSKLLAMTENLQLPPKTVHGEDAPRGAAIDGASLSGVISLQPESKFPPVSTGTAPRTGPGQMLQFRGQILAVEGELGKLRDRLKEHEGAAPTRKLDPKKIVPSRWANRHPDSFGTPEFARLKQDIELAGGNVQPISVRLLIGHQDQYEIVFGHRRHRACSELGIPVLATIDSAAASDQDLFSAMDRENRERADLSPFEQGTMYRRALDEKLYPSNRRLAEALGVSHTWVANVLQVADLPTPVVECFKSPLDIQHRHAKSLAEVLDTDRKGILRRAEKLRAQESPKATASNVVATLIGARNDRPLTDYQPIEHGGEKIGQWSKDRSGRLIIQIEAIHAADDHHHVLLKSIIAALR